MLHTQTVEPFTLGLLKRLMADEALQLAAISPIPTFDTPENEK